MNESYLIRCDDIQNITPGQDLVILGKFYKDQIIEYKESFIGILLKNPNDNQYGYYVWNKENLELDLEITNNSNKYYCIPLNSVFEVNGIRYKYINSAEPQSKGYVNQD